VARIVDEDELIEHWTLVGEELTQVAAKRGPTKLAFALMLKFHQLHGRFPRGRVELPVEVVEFVAKAVKVPAAELTGYEWDGRTSKYHRTQIRRFTGFRECGVADADKATDWLIEGVCQSERRPERVRVALLAYLREERIEPPAAIRLSRMVGSALERAEQGLTRRICSRIPLDAVSRMLALIARRPSGEEDEETGTNRGCDVRSQCAVRRWEPKEVQDLLAGLSQQPGWS
jgi:Domain of unknown function (DUF4158)